MMGINIHNYEQYFLDHLEGNLSPEMEKELLDFLAAHPELREMLEDMDAVSPLPDNKIEFAHKDHLKRNIHRTPHIHEKNAEEWMVSSIEGLLDAGQEIELADFIRKNPVFLKELEAFKKTRLQKDESIIFPQKEMLRKKAPLLTFTTRVWLASAVAAAVILFFGIRYFISPGETILKVEPALVATHPGNPETIEVKKDPGSAPENRPISNDIILSEADQPVRRTALTDSAQLRQSPYRLTQSYTASPIQAGPKVLAQAEVKKIRKSSGTVEPENRSIVGKVTDNLFARAESSFRQNTRSEVSGKKRFTFWGLLDSGIKGYNTITDRDIELYVRRDENGKVESYTLVENNRLITSRELNTY